MIKTTRKFRKISWFPERTESKVLRPVPVLSFVLPSGGDSAGHDARAVFFLEISLQESDEPQIRN